MTTAAQGTWYDVVEGGALEQGDLLFQCPIYVPQVESFPLIENQEVDIRVELFDVIVMTQSCDLENDKAQDVVLCAHWDVEEVKKHTPALGRPGAISEVKSGRRPRYTLLNRSGQVQPGMGLRIVDCGKVFSLPIAFVRSLAAYQGPRLRLLSPYREHLSQSFARFFMRVGLPQDIEL